MKVLVACEFSGVVRDAFLEAGHDAVSCDLLPTESPGPHVQGDVRPLLRKAWDLVVAHPPCTYLANSGVRWLYAGGGMERHQRMMDAASFFEECLYEANAPRVAVENPVIHKHAKLPKWTQTLQPWQFGHGEVKRVCLWLRGLPPLEPTDIVEGREARVHRMPPSPDRAKERSRFFPGIARAMAAQWGPLCSA